MRDHHERRRVAGAVQRVVAAGVGGGVGHFAHAGHRFHQHDCVAGGGFACGLVGHGAGELRSLRECAGKKKAATVACKNVFIDLMVFLAVLILGCWPLVLAPVKGAPSMRRLCFCRMGGKARNHAVTHRLLSLLLQIIDFGQQLRGFVFKLCSLCLKVFFRIFAGAKFEIEVAQIFVELFLALLEIVEARFLVLAGENILRPEGIEEQQIAIRQPRAKPKVSLMAQ